MSEPNEAVPSDGQISEVPTQAVPPSPSGGHETPEAHGPLRAGLVLSCLGVVYGDIGTSPLYALREGLVHAHEHHMAETVVIGIVSLLFWTVFLIVTVKYVVLILRADNKGEGGTLSLVAKAQGALHQRAWWLYRIRPVSVRFRRFRAASSKA